MIKQYWKPVLKVLVSLAGLLYIFASVDIKNVVAIFDNISWFWVIITLTLAILSLVIRAYRWLVLLQGVGGNIPFSKLVSMYFIGNFFNSFLPTGFGGDVVRVLEASKSVKSEVAAGTVIVDRMTGLLMLFVIAILALPFRPDNFPNDIAFFVFVAGVIGLFGGFLVLDGRLLRLFGAWLPKIISPVGDGPVARVLDVVQAGGWVTVMKAMGVSAVFNLVQIGWWFTAGKAIFLSIPFLHHLLVVPIFSALLLLPSIGGIGVREAAAPLLYASAGVGEEQAIALAFLVTFVTRILAAIPGGFLYAFTGREQSLQSALE